MLRLERVRHVISFHVFRVREDFRGEPRKQPRKIAVLLAGRAGRQLEHTLTALPQLASVFGRSRLA
jgi:hypothetical protein